AIVYEDTGALAPMVYFDIVAAYGTMNGTIEAELATRVLIPGTDGTTDVKFLSSGRLRCSLPSTTKTIHGGSSKKPSTSYRLKPPGQKGPTTNRSPRKLPRCWRSYSPQSFRYCLQRLLTALSTDY
ncbi:MAG TPA: hypothetical protein VF396_11040, partial [Bradyrhizobium sp.]